MKRIIAIWLGIVFALIAVSGVLIAVDGKVAEGVVVAVLFSAIAWRTWYLAGEARSPRG